MAWPYRLAIVLLSTTFAVTAGLMLAPEACGLGLTFGVVLVLLQVQGFGILRVATALFRRDSGDLELGVRTRLAGHLVVVGLCVAVAAMWSALGAIDQGPAFIAAAVPFSLLALVLPAAIARPRS